MTYNGTGHDESPKRGHRVSSNGLKHRHIVLRIFSLDSIGFHRVGGLLIVLAGYMLNFLRDLFARSGIVVGHAAGYESQGWMVDSSGDRVKVW